MTDAQWKERLLRIAYESQWADREFRKKCVTLGIVTFLRETPTRRWYTVRYRGRYITTLFGDVEDKSKLLTMWSVIRTAEQLIEEVEGVKHESN